MTTPTSVVIIGGGLAGAKAAEALRDKGFTGPVTVISKEADLPYERPPLSKEYLMGDKPFDKAVVHPADWYRDHTVDLRASTTAASFDPAAHTVTLPVRAAGDRRQLRAATSE